MNTRLATLILAACLGITGCNNRAKEQEAIKRVFSERAKARADASMTIQQRPPFQRTQQALNEEILARLKKIEFTACPQDFQNAWLEYVQSWERFAAPTATELKEQQLRERATKSSLQMGATTGIAMDNRNLQDAAKRLESQDTGEPLRRLESIALTYGVDVLKLE